MTIRDQRARWLALLLLLGSTIAWAEQKAQLGPWDVHYVVVGTMFLKPEVAANYGVTRGRDRAFMNLSVLDPEGTPVRADVSGIMINLLSQREPLRFREVLEGDAIYYLAEFKHTDRDTLRFVVDIVPPDGEARQLEFQQRMYWDGR